ncbi:hypothetical protein Pcinc_021497 [Petrolisthes cinctipes]|uniref:Zinc finger PHD-type domain-containing protein n=1 Tax=Petrolisthes cinctipes TaxID=88211 RepID=A0AAE1FHL3_PETCI|nr:hypothetical protein Pcinc_021497 [Petrolisthes cinctipes]
MDKLITSRIVKPNKELCNKCTKEVSTPAIRCDQCKNLLHVSCTHLPCYTVIKYFTSRIQFTCENCVKLGIEEYQTLVDWTAITELRADIKLLNRTINNENKDNRRQLYPDMLQTSQQPNQQADANQAMTQTRQVKHPGTLYADVAGKVKPNQHAVFIKPKDLTTPSNNKEIISTLKQVPMVTAKTIQQKTMKLVFPSESTKDRAVEALEANDQIADNHQIISEKKLKPKISITFMPDCIEDSEIIKSIQDKNENLAELMTEEEDIKLLFTKPSTPRHKTAVIIVSPNIRKQIEKNDNRIYLHFSSDPQEISEALNNQYVSVFSTPNLDRRNHWQTAATTPAELQLNEIEISKSSIESSIREMNTFSAAGPDGIPAVLMKQYLPDEPHLPHYHSRAPTNSIIDWLALRRADGDFTHPGEATHRDPGAQHRV